MNTEKLKALALTATPGPWITGRNRKFEIFSTEKVCNGEDDFPPIIAATLEDNGVDRVKNAEFIAAANPAAILDLIAERDELLAAINALISTMPGSDNRHSAIKKARAIARKYNAGES